MDIRRLLRALNESPLLTLSTSNPDDVARAKGLHVGQQVQIDAYVGTVSHVSTTRRTRTLFHDTDPTSLEQHTVPYDVVTISLKLHDSFGQTSKHTFK